MRRVPKFLTENTYEFPALDRQIDYSLPYSAKQKQSSARAGIIALIILLILVFVKLAQNNFRINEGLFSHDYFTSLNAVAFVGLAIFVSRTLIKRPVILTEETISYKGIVLNYRDIAEVVVETDLADRSPTYGMNTLVIKDKNSYRMHIAIDLFPHEEAAVIFNAIISHKPDVITSWDIQALADCAKRIDV